MQKNLIYFLLVFQALVCAISICVFDGTYEVGDSVVHYLFARWAPFHPVLYFDHWAKPLFVLLASPFAQFGFTGMKVFNSLVSIACTYLTFKVATELKLRNSIIAAVIMIFAPLNYILCFTGFTEPLFALFTVWGLLLCLRKKYVAAAIVISFLPYIRSEGLIIAGIFGFYFLMEKNWKKIPLLLTGSVIYGIAGYFVYHDLLWVFTKIPYATMKSVYGHGTLTHFIEQLLYVIGVPLYALFCIGFLITCRNILKKKCAAEMSIIVFLGFGAFFMAHTLFWYLGIFNSFGLKRVLIGIMPFIALITLEGFNFVTEDLLKSNYKRALKFALLAYVIIFPVTPNPAAIEWEDDMQLGKDQACANEIAQVVKLLQPGEPLVFDYHYFSIPMNMDFYDPLKHVDISRESIKKMKPGDMMLWESLFAEQAADISFAGIDSIPSLQKILSRTVKSYGHDITFHLYRKKN